MTNTIAYPVLVDDPELGDVWRVFIPGHGTDEETTYDTEEEAQAKADEFNLLSRLSPIIARNVAFQLQREFCIAMSCYPTYKIDIQATDSELLRCLIAFTHESTGGTIALELYADEKGEPVQTWEPCLSWGHK